MSSAGTNSAGANPVALQAENLEAAMNYFPAAQKSVFEWRVIPGFVGLIISVAEIGYAVIFLKQPYLAIPGGVGGVISIYFIYLGHNYHLLHTYEENNQKLAFETELLRNNNDRLRSQVDRLQRNNTIYADLNGQLNEEIEYLDKANEKLHGNLNNLEGSVVKLQQVQETIETQATEHAELFTTLLNSLQGICDSSKKTEAEIEEKVKVHATLLKQLEDATTHFSAGQSEAQKKQVELMAQMNATAQTLCSALANCDSFKKLTEYMESIRIHDEHLSAVIEKEQATEKRNQEKEEQIALKIERLAKLEGNVEKLEITNSELEATKNNLNGEIGKLSEQVTRLQGMLDNRG
jgi:DNA repair exonuclease SbcCD ATPase subunit